LREEERQRLERPKLSTQNAPTKGKRRRSVEAERMVEQDEDALEQSVDAILAMWVFVFL
jgi:hypothetical protein